MSGGAGRKAYQSSLGLLVLLLGLSLGLLEGIGVRSLGLEDLGGGDCRGSSGGGGGGGFGGGHDGYVVRWLGCILKYVCGEGQKVRGSAHKRLLGTANSLGGLAGQDTFCDDDD